MQVAASPSKPSMSAIKPENGITVVQSIKEYTDYLRGTTNGQIKKGTVGCHLATLRSLQRWTEREDVNIVYAKDFKTLHATNFMEFRGVPQEHDKVPLSPNTQPNYVTRLNGYGEWLDLHEYCVGNFARKLEPPKGVAVKRVPISDEKFKLLVQLAHQITTARPAEVTGYEVETVMLIMRNAGMGIADGATLDPSEIVGREIQYYRTKTEDEPIPCQGIIPMSKKILERLQVLKERQGLYDGKFFYQGTSGGASTWRYILTPLFEAAGLEGCKTHGFRHAFAEEMLTTTAIFRDPFTGLPTTGLWPVSSVAVYLAHANEKTTIKYYNAAFKRRASISSALMLAKHDRDELAEALAAASESGVSHVGTV